MNGTFAIEARALRRTFKGDVEAVRDIDLTVAEGEVFGFRDPGLGRRQARGMLWRDPRDGLAAHGAVAKGNREV